MTITPGIVVLVVMCPVVLNLAMWRVGVYSNVYERAWRDISGVRASRRKVRFVGQSNTLTWIAERLNLNLQLKRAGMRKNPERFLLSCVAYGAAVALALVIVDAVVGAISYSTPIPLYWALFAFVGITVLKLLEVPRAVKARQAAINDAITEIMVPLTLVSGPGGIASVPQALVMFSRCLDDPTLAQFLQIPEAYGETRDGSGAVDFRVLVADQDRQARNDIVLFREIGEAYGLELFLALSGALVQASQNRDKQDCFLAVANQYQERQVDEDEEWVEQAQTKSNIPMTLFLLLVFAALLIPLVYIILSTLGAS